MALTVLDAQTQLSADPARMALRLFLPGEDTHEEGSRVAEIAARVLAVSEEAAEAEAARIVTSFTGGVDHLTEALQAHAASVGYAAGGTEGLSTARRILLGAAFSAEYAVEGAALCNPSVVPHPDQTGLKAGQLRVVVALRGIGEGHISTIEYISAVVGPGPRWVFGERRLPLVIGETSPPHWVREHFMVEVEAHMRVHGTELAHAVARLLPERFTTADFDTAVHRLPTVLLHRHQATQQLDRLRTVVESAYRSTFPEDSDLSQRVLMPASRDEVNGMEDARFVQYTHEDGRVDYRATYTAYDGRHIAPRLIVSRDLLTFDIHRLSGPAAKNKGMALFPRRVHGELLALTRSDGETLGISRSDHGRVWQQPTPLHRPSSLWDIIQAGNCGSPLETEHGWLVLTHGVGPMRAYSIGAMLLDLDHPRRVVATLEQPLLEPHERHGYVPNVVYSCGGVIHDGRLWIPHGVGDNRIRVASVGVDELVGAMVPVARTPPDSRAG